MIKNRKLNKVNQIIKMMFFINIEVFAICIFSTYKSVAANIPTKMNFREYIKEFYNLNVSVEDEKIDEEIENYEERYAMYTNPEYMFGIIGNVKTVSYYNGECNLELCQVLSGNNIIEKVINFFKTKGLNDYAIAGILGNFEAESGISTVAYQGKKDTNYDEETYTSGVNNGTISRETFVNDAEGYGICQFTYPAYKAQVYDLANNNDLPVSSLEVQLSVLWAQMNGIPGLLQRLNQTSDVEEATKIFMLQYERPQDQSIKKQQDRITKSYRYYDLYFD